MIVYDKLLYSSKELFDSYLHGKKYSIPPYQRGYKCIGHRTKRICVGRLKML